MIVNIQKFQVKLNESENDIRQRDLILKENLEKVESIDLKYQRAKKVASNTSGVKQVFVYFDIISNAEKLRLEQPQVC